MNDLAGDIRFIVPTCMRDRISNFLGASLKLCPSEAQRLKHAVVSTPWYEYYRVANLQAHNILDVANPKLALEQHDNLLRMHLDISVLMLLICQSSKIIRTPYSRVIRHYAHRKVILNFGLELRRDRPRAVGWRQLSTVLENPRQARLSFLAPSMVATCFY